MLLFEILAIIYIILFILHVENGYQKEAHKNNFHLKVFLELKI